MRAKTTICSGFSSTSMGISRPLALDFFHLAVAQDFFKKHSFVCDVLVNDPQAVVAGGQNEGFAQLAEGFERAEMVEGGGGLLGFDEGRLPRRQLNLP